MRARRSGEAELARGGCCCCACTAAALLPPLQPSTSSFVIRGIASTRSLRTVGLCRRKRAFLIDGSGRQRRRPRRPRALEGYGRRHLAPRALWDVQDRQGALRQGPMVSSQLVAEGHLRCAPAPNPSGPRRDSGRHRCLTGLTCPPKLWLSWLGAPSPWLGAAPLGAAPEAAETPSTGSSILYEHLNIT